MPKSNSCRSGAPASSPGASVDVSDRPRHRAPAGRLLLDEPLSNLDAELDGRLAATMMSPRDMRSRKHIQDLLLGYGGFEQAAVLITSANDEKR